LTKPGGLDVHIKDEHKNVVYRTLDEINAAGFDAGNAGTAVPL